MINKINDDEKKIISIRKYLIKQLKQYQIWYKKNTDDDDLNFVYAGKIGAYKEILKTFFDIEIKD
jgi:hypothetical protein